MNIYLTSCGFFRGYSGVLVDTRIYNDGFLEWFVEIAFEIYAFISRQCIRLLNTPAQIFFLSSKNNFLVISSGLSDHFRYVLYVRP